MCSLTVHNQWGRFFISPLCLSIWLIILDEWLFCICVDADHLYTIVNNNSLFLKNDFAFFWVCVRVWSDVKCLDETLVFARGQIKWLQIPPTPPFGIQDN